MADLTMLQHRDIEHVTSYAHDFRDGHGGKSRTWSFSADEHGVLWEQLGDLAQQNYLNLTDACLYGEAEGWVESWDDRRIVVGKGKCACGAIVKLHESDNECSCGRIYTFSGQHVTRRHDDRAAWEADGGEAICGEHWDEEDY